MTLQRDLLTPTATAQGESTKDFVSLLQEHVDVLKDIRRQLMRQNPPVLCTTVVQNAGVSGLVVNDTNQHQVLFLQQMQRRTIYQLHVWSNYGQTVYISYNSMGQAKDGIPVVSGNVLVLPVEIDALWLWVPTLAVAMPINGNADPTNGGIAIYGWTIPSYEEGQM